MPAVELITNVKASLDCFHHIYFITLVKSEYLILCRRPLSTAERPEGIRTRAIKELVGSPEATSKDIYNYNELLSFGGSFEPAFFLQMITPEANIGFSSAISKLLKERLGVDSKRRYIVFMNPGKENIGFLDSTVAALGI